MKNVSFIIASLSILLISTTTFAQDAELLYSTHCAGCHGADLRGTTSASALVKTEWQRGNDRQAIAATIREGIPSTTMTTWQNVFTDRQIKALADFIVEANSGKQAGETAVTSVGHVQETASADSNRINSLKYPLQIERLVTRDISTPWGIEFVNSDTALISEREGNLKWMVRGTIDPNPIRSVPATHTESSTGGYMDIALDPEYHRNGWVYLAYSHTNGDINDPEARALTKVVRGRIRNHRWIDQQTLFEVPDSLMVVNGNRWGCRFLFDEQQRLYFSIGDMARADDSQDLSKAVGKVFRINKDGSIPEDNPFVDHPGALPQIFTIGNRNVQGIDQHPATGQIWATEHGPQG
ncbi:MAG: PQQ-dependent sugar dehydrogenase, partial [Balneolaceae bacterium]|nr:PQQ-dependent sugar dehydrogenase [Balneolaceae bacterium]